MEKLENMIKDNREAFENVKLPEGHKDRFLRKVAGKKRAARREMVLKIAAAFLIFAAVSIPWIYNDSNGYLAKIERESNEVYNLAQQLDPLHKDMVINTLEQLTTEAVPFIDQLPENLDNKTVKMMKREYYGPKIEGIEKLHGYVTELLQN